MKSIPICTADFRKALKSATNLKHTVLPKDFAFEVYLQVDDDLYKKITGDAVLAEKVFKGVSKEYKRAVSEMAELAGKIDVEFGKSLKPKGWAAQQWQKQAPGILKQAERRMLDGSCKTIKQWQQVRKDRKNYVIKSAAKVTVGSLGIATATLGSVVAAGGVAATGGAAVPGLVAAIYANVKAVANLGKQVHRLKLNVDQAESVVRDQLDSLRVAYGGSSRRGVAAKEIGKAAVEQFLVVPMKSISSAETALSDYKGKLAKVDINVSEMGVKLNRTLDEQEKLDALVVKKLDKMLADAGYKSKKLPGLQKKVLKLNAMIQTQLKTMPDSIRRVEDGHKRYRTVYAPALRELKAQKPGWVDYAEASLKLGDLALGAGFTSFDQLDSVLVLVDSIAVEADDLLAEKLL